MKTIQENSYHTASFVDFDEERLRLQTQATLLHQFELDLLKRHGLQDTHTVLDMGCGQGFLAHAVSRYLTEGHLDAVDINASFIADAQKTFTTPNLTFHCSTVLEYAPEVTYDFIYARLLLQHLSDPLATILHLKQYLKPGGKLCFIDVNDEWLFLEPHLPAFDTLVSESIHFQQLQGGDRLIAKKLPGYLQRTGFEKPQLEVVPFSSALVGMETFLEVAISFRANYSYKEVNGQELYEAIKATVLPAPEAYFGLMGVFCISASKS
jgi:trans-aconitate methyltransferase